MHLFLRQGQTPILFTIRSLNLRPRSEGSAPFFYRNFRCRLVRDSLRNPSRSYWVPFSIMATGVYPPFTSESLAQLFLPSIPLLLSLKSFKGESAVLFSDLASKFGFLLVGKFSDNHSLSNELYFQEGQFRIGFGTSNVLSFILPVLVFFQNCNSKWWSKICGDLFINPATN